MTFGTFFLPGPTEVRPAVLNAMTRPMMQHRSAEFERMFAGLQSGLREVFGTTRPVYICTSSATGLMEAGVRYAPAGDILSLVNGAFSERFAEIGEACGRLVDRYEVPWGEAHDPVVLREYLGRKSYTAITVAHSETSSGVLNDVHAINSVAHEFGALCLVDSVSGIAGAELHFDASGFDYVLTGSQKALALPPGLALGVASDAFLAAGGNAPSRGVYLNLAEYEEFARNNQAPNTPALSLYYALDVQLKDIVAEGMQARWARHLALAKLTYDWVTEMRDAHSIALSILAPVGHRSPTVAAVVLPPGFTSDIVVPKVAERGITISQGYGKLKSSTVRIGHMGDHTMEGMGRCLAACSEALLAIKASL
jgi:aspartate aminotransferase-like enzyme